jgi:hypothetical protein
MPLESHDIPKVMRIHLLITQYPIMADTIRERMRQEIFTRGIISPARLEEEAREKAIQSQKREGLAAPYLQEPADVWQRRLGQIRDYLTDFYFAYNLPHYRFEQIVQDILLERAPSEEVLLTYNPELAPWDVLFRQGEEYEALPDDMRAPVQHHLQEIKVVLIKAMISDQLAFVRVAKEYMHISDLEWIRARRIGQGKIGGKSAGILLAWQILKQAFAAAEGEVPHVVVPESYFIGADVFYEFLSLNNISYYVNQKYKSLEQIEGEYPALQETYLRGRFPEYVTVRLKNLLAEVAGQPLIVRSSSLLEDNFETSFAGKYESVFCPNQGTPAENLMALTQAVARVYASVSNPNALLYRKQRGLLDFDERMAVLIQVVQGEMYHGAYFPPVAGMAYSRNSFIWNPKLRREDGFARLVAGMGTRAVERVGEDYPRMVALSHPNLRPESGSSQVRYYSQYYMDVIDLAKNSFDTRRVVEMLGGDYPWLRLIASRDDGEYISPIVMHDPSLDPRQLVLTFDGLLGQTPFVKHLKALLKALEFGYGTPVDIEFTLSLRRSEAPVVHLLQCRPQSSQEQVAAMPSTEDVPREAVLFGTNKMVPIGRVCDVRYLVYVDPRRYIGLRTQEEKLQLARVVGQINQRLEGQKFLLMGPGRWGSSNPDLGMHVGYADIYNTSALVEIGLAQGGIRPTLSYGTHFFQDLVESHIYPLAIFPDEPGNPFNEEFFSRAINALPALLPNCGGYGELIKVIDVPATTGGRVVDLIMNGEQGKAVAYLTAPSASGVTRD